MAGLTMIKNAKEKSADIWIYQDIGEGWFEGFTAKDFADELKGLGKVDILNVYINSLGGDVFDGVAIYNILKRHKAKVYVEVDALAASIASVIAMAGDIIRMAENSIMMIHEVSGFVMGTAKDMRSVADEIDKIQKNAIIPAYVNQTGMEEKELLKLMAEETWMSADEALEYGFIDEIVGAKKMAACAIDPKKFQFKRIPECLANKKITEIKQKKEAKTSGGSIEITKWQRKIAAR